VIPSASGLQAFRSVLECRRADSRFLVTWNETPLSYILSFEDVSPPRIMLVFPYIECSKTGKGPLSSVLGLRELGGETLLGKRVIYSESQNTFRCMKELHIRSARLLALQQQQRAGLGGHSFQAQTVTWYGFQSRAWSNPLSHLSSAVIKAADFGTYSDMQIKPVFNFFSRKHSFSIFSYLKA
jgi:hypothetical protein